MNQAIKKRIEDINNGIVPEGYKQTPFGIFPCDWKAEEEFADFCEINPKTEKLPEKFIYIDLESVVDGKLIQKNIVYCDNAPSRAQRVLSDNDVIYQMVRPYQKNNFIFKISDKELKSVASTGYAQLRNDIPAFLYQVVNSDYFCFQVLAKCTGTNYPAINSEDLGTVAIAFPENKTEQGKIAEILMKWEEMVELQEKYIQKLELRKKSIIQKMLMNNKGWIKTPLTKVLKERKTYAILDSEYPHVTLGKSGVVDKTEQYERDFLVKSDDKEYKITYPGDIVYNPANLKFGVICVNQYSMPAIFSPIYVTFEVNDEYNVDFIGAVLCSENFVRYIRKYEEGSLYERQAVKPEDFLKGEILIPEKKEQEDIAKVIQLADEEISLQKEKLDRIKIQRKAMQQYLLTGIVRVS